MLLSGLRQDMNNLMRRDLGPRQGKCRGQIEYNYDMI